MTKFVLDCSVTMSWCFSDEANAYADVVLGSMQASLHGAAVVPNLWSLEVANVLLVAERRQRLTPAQTTRAITLLQALPITIDVQTAQQAFLTTLALGRNYGISAYDAAYLELAMRLGLPIATVDKRLSVIASQCGVEIYLSAASLQP